MAKKTDQKKCLLACLDRLEERLGLVREQLATKRDVSPPCQAAYDIAVAASASATAAHVAAQAADDIALVAWEAYWDCESP